jgi:hypothetical protein
MSIRRKEGDMHMSFLWMVVVDNESRQPCEGVLGQCGVMVGQPNVEYKKRLVLMEQRLVDVEDIVGDLDKTMDGLPYFYLKHDELQQILEKVVELRTLEQFIEQEK